MVDPDFKVDREEMEVEIPEKVKQVRSKLKEEHTFTVPDQCDEFLARCLRLKDGDVEKAVKLVMAYSVVLEIVRNWDGNFQPSLHKYHYNSGAYVPLIKRDSSGRLILYVDAGLWDTDRMNLDQVSICSWMLIQYAMAEDTSLQRNGFVMIWDFGTFSLKQALAVTHRRLLSFAKMVQNGVSGRMKEFHVINHPSIIGLIYKAIKPFLSEKLKKRVTFHENIHSLLEQVDEKCLPSFVGGSLDTDEYVDNDLLNDFFNCDQYFKDMMNLGLPTK